MQWNFYSKSDVIMKNISCAVIRINLHQSTEYHINTSWIELPKFKLLIEN